MLIIHASSFLLLGKCKKNNKSNKGMELSSILILYPSL